MRGRFNFNHLYYFWMVAKEGNLTKTAEKLFVAQSALSMQIKKLEEQIGVKLFVKVGRKLELSEAGLITFSYAEKIFKLGNELGSVLHYNFKNNKTTLKIGVISSLSRNFVENFIKPLLTREDTEIVLESGSEEDLLNKLFDHRLDLILSNLSPKNSISNDLRIKSIAKQQISIVGKPANKKAGADLQSILKENKILLPGVGTDIRSKFDQVCDDMGLQYDVLAEINDMPALRLLARDSGAIALLPIIVVQDEIRNGMLEEYCRIPGLYEHFYAISLRKQYEPEIIRFLLANESLGKA
ncbi:MAG TPA: LysR family transcriptional regulator [Methylophilus sp.]|nr:LysR family transcriptional regulator [Methylophilus sp.]HQQ32978.1 LysR family transcriptional regulator [Methylophilus sp.]